jgi:XTP/dITP diphosphohydrolase
LENKDKNVRYVAVIALYFPDSGVVRTFRAEQKGKVVSSKGEPRAGLEYDSIFFVPEFGKTQAELTVVEKNRVSHRAQAARAAMKFLEKYV